MRAKPGVNTREFIETHFKDILGKVIAPYSDRDIVALALEDEEYLQHCIDNEHDVSKKRKKELYLEKIKVDNKKTKALLREYFEMEPFKLGEDASKLVPPPSFAPAYIPGTSKRGVLMVMLENYGTRFYNFSASGKVAVPVIYTKNGMEILGNLESIGSVLFHTWSIASQHLFATLNKLSVVPKPQVPNDYYILRNPKKPDDIPEEVEFLYVLIDLDINNELASGSLNCTNRIYEDKKQRYDPQYATLDELQSQ